MNKKQLDEKHQKILRKLLQLPENKKCFDCSEKVPHLPLLAQFGTFGGGTRRFNFFLSFAK